MQDAKVKVRLLAFGLLVIIVATIAVVAGYHDRIVSLAHRLPIISRIFRTTSEAQIAKYGAGARARLSAKFQKKGLKYPPENVVLIAMKSAYELQVYAVHDDAPAEYICSYPILGASGVLGPKLRSGDCQVPEGIYQVSLEPNTPYHLALRINYPNQTDLSRAKVDGRTNPGSDILIHGNAGSIGCLAMGDPASEDLFVLVYDTHNKQAPLIITPVDFRSQASPPTNPADPKWLPELYGDIKNEICKFPKPN